MQDSPLVAIRQTTQQLEHEQGDGAGGQAARVLLQVLTEVGVDVLEHEDERLAGVHYVVQGDDVRVLQASKQRS